MRTTFEIGIKTKTKVIYTDVRVELPMVPQIGSTLVLDQISKEQVEESTRLKFVTGIFHVWLTTYVMTSDAHYLILEGEIQ